MPELPEVETVLRTLENQIKDRQIIGVKILYHSIIEGDSKVFEERIINQHFRDFKRRGKFLLFELDDITFVSHLRMEGKYYILEKDDPIDKHTHVIFYLDNGKELRYHDVRKFGRMEIINKESDYRIFKNLGPEPFSKEFDEQYIKKYLSKSKKCIKEVLLNQNFVAGVGNIYVDEILWSIKVLPNRNANSLNEKEIEDLLLYTRKILKEAIKAGGTTIRSYTSSLGVTGRFQLSLKCHTKDRCPRCGEKIEKIRVGGRGTYYCPKCQK